MIGGAIGLNSVMRPLHEVSNPFSPFQIFSRCEFSPMSFSHFLLIVGTLVGVCYVSFGLK